MPFSNSYATIARWSCRRIPSGLMQKVFVALLSCGIGVVASAYAQAPSPRGGVADPKLDGRVESILQQMTQEEKVGQLVQYSAGQPTGPGTGRLIMTT